MTSYFLAFLWGICILFSFIGWGSALNRIFFPKYRIDWGQKAAWGIAFSTFVGGILNVAWIISRATILVYLGVGLLFWLFDIFKTKLSVISLLFNPIWNCRKDKIVIIGIVAIFLLALLQYGGWISTHDFNIHDDYQGYLVFPNKMLQAGSMGPDPFSERRLVSSLGGHSFLHTFILSMLSEKNLNIIDPGLGIIIGIGLLLGCFKNKGVPKRAAVFILILFLLAPLPKANTTALLIPLVLFISLFRTLDWDGLETERFWANAFIIALLASAICTTKLNNIPACGILFALSYFFYIVGAKTRGKPILEFFIATILVGLFLLPWMILLYQSSGTLLYPLLGKGYHGSVYGTFLPHWTGLTISRLTRMFFYYLGEFYVISLILLSFISFRPLRANAGRRASLSLWISALLGALIILITIRISHPRFYFPFAFAAIIILITIAMAETAEKGQSRFKNYTFAFMAVFVAGAIIGNNWGSLRWYSHRRGYFSYSELIRNIKIGVKNIPLASDEEVFRYARMQQSIPEGATVLTRFDKPFLLDFGRNTLFIADYPGGASPPPGMPSFKGPEALANYLNSKSIRYVAYSYANEAEFTWEKYGDRVRHGHPGIRTEAQHTFDFQHNLKQLGETRKRIYDDGHIFVLDLLNRGGQK